MAFEFFVIDFVVGYGEYMRWMGFAVAGVHEGSGWEATFAQFGFWFFLRHVANIRCRSPETKKRVLRKTNNGLPLGKKIVCWANFFALDKKYLKFGTVFGLL